MQPASPKSTSNAATAGMISPGTTSPDAALPARAAVRRARSRRRAVRSRAHYVTGGLCVAVLLAGLAVGLPWLAGTRKAAQVTPPAEAGAVHVGTMLMALEGDYCRRMAFDNSSGAMWEVERIRCAGMDATPVDSAEAVRQRYSGGRLEAIRRSFADR